MTEPAPDATEQSAPAEQSQVAKEPAAAPGPVSKGRSPVEKAIVWGLIGIGLTVACIEARARVGYGMSVAYMQQAMEAETEAEDAAEKERLEQLEADVLGGNAGSAGAPPLPVPDEDDVPTAEDLKVKFEAPLPAATLKGMRGKAFGKWAFLAPVLAGSQGKIERKQMDYRTSLHWFSVKDLFTETPPYKLELVVTDNSPAAEIIYGVSASAARFDNEKLGDAAPAAPLEAKTSYDQNKMAGEMKGFKNQLKKRKERRSKSKKNQSADKNTADKNTADKGSAEDKKDDEGAADVDENKDSGEKTPDEKVEAKSDADAKSGTDSGAKPKVDDDSDKVEL